MRNEWQQSNIGFPTLLSQGDRAAIAASLLLNELGLYSEKGWKRKEEEKIPWCPRKGCSVTWTTWIWNFRFFVAISVSVLRKSPPVVVNRIGPAQLLILPRVNTVRPLQLKLSSSTFFCVSVELNPILPLHQWRGLHPGREVKAGIAEDGHLCNSLVLEPYSPFMSSEQQEETWVWPNRSRERTGRGRRNAWTSTRSKWEQGKLWGEGREPTALLQERSSQQRDLKAWAIHQTAGKLIYAIWFWQGWGLGLPKISLDHHRRVSSFILQLLLACAGLLATSPPAGSCCSLVCCK